MSGTILGTRERMINKETKISAPKRDMDKRK